MAAGVSTRTIGTSTYLVKGYRPRVEANRTRTANRYLKQVRYGNDRPYDGTVPDQWCFELVLDYGEHHPAEPTPAEQATWPAGPIPF